MPPGGLNIRHELDQIGQERRLHELQSAPPPPPSSAPTGSTGSSGPAGRRPGSASSPVGKSYLDVRQALEDIGIDETRAVQLGIRLFKIACPWPLDLEHVRDFARDLDMVIVVEEKRSLIEVQLREDLYGTAMQPTIGRQEGRSAATGCSRSTVRSMPTTSRSPSASACSG